MTPESRTDDPLLDVVPAKPPPRHAAFLRRLIAERAPKRRSPGVAGQLCQEQRVGTASPEGDFVLYEDADFARAADVLRQWNEAIELDPLAASLPAAMRYSPHYVAAMPLNMGFSLPPSCDFVTTTLRAARELAFEVIVACEKLETLARLERYSWLARFIRSRRTLALFSGAASGIYRAETAQRLINGSAAPVLALYDFNPSGLHKAATLPRLEALCMPSWPDLEPALQCRKPEPSFIHQRRQLRDRLDQVTCTHVSQAWRLMNAVGNGIAVEDFPT